MHETQEFLKKKHFHRNIFMINKDITILIRRRGCRNSGNSIHELSTLFIEIIITSRQKINNKREDKDEINNKKVQLFKIIYNLKITFFNF